MDINFFGEMIKEWAQPICAIASIAISIAVFFINKKVNSEMRRLREKEELLHQASRVSAWLVSPRSSLKGDGARVHNASDLPVYNVVVTAVVTKGGKCSEGELRRGHCDYRSVLAVVPPGEHSFALDLTGFWGMSAYPVLEVGFTCADGNSWVRKGDGELLQIDVDPLSYYGIGLPCCYGELND